MDKKIDLSIHIFGLRIFSKDRQRLLEIILDQINSGKFTRIYTPNPEQIIQSRQNSQFLEVLQGAEICIPDGVGLLIASRLFTLLGIKKRSLQEQIRGRELVVDLLKIAKEQGLTVMVIGGRNYSQESEVRGQGRAVQLTSNTQRSFSVQQEWCGMKSIHWMEGYKDAKNPTLEEERNLEKEIARIKPDILFVAFGAPTQEFWIESHTDLLKKNKVKLAMAVGGSFDYLLGIVTQVPRLIYRLGLEWLFRLIRQPWRLRRQLRLVQFIYLVLKTSFIRQDSRG